MMKFMPLILFVGCCFIKDIAGIFYLLLLGDLSFLQLPSVIIDIVQSLGTMLVRG